MKKILIADDHQLVRQGLKMVLSDEFGEIQFGEAENASSTLKKMDEDSWNLLILDMNMPGRSGTEVLKDLKDQRNSTPVLMLSMHSEEYMGLRAIKLGAYGYISKDMAGSELINAVHQIFSGKKYISPTLASMMVDRLNEPAEKEPHELLSDREFQTFLLIAAGKQVSAIAETLSLSVATISTYRSRIMEKTGMKSNAALMNYAIHKGLA
ncbi:MAG: response regulator [Bacteroidia bacterium]